MKQHSRCARADMMTEHVVLAAAATVAVLQWQQWLLWPGVPLHHTGALQRACFRTPETAVLSRDHWRAVFQK
jgi:hypothetical protein